MMRCVVLMAMMGFLAVLAPAGRAAEIVVLTEKPVAEFTLPDGTVLKNAFVWRRSSEGIMVVHDDGQYFLNYKILPDAWRKAYAVGDKVGQVPVAISKRYDQYSIHPLLEHIKGMSRMAVVFYESERYKGDADELLISACALQALLEGRQPKARRLRKILVDRFPESEVIDLDAMFDVCEGCKGGVKTMGCRVCSGSGECPECAGSGKRESRLQNAKSVHCTVCRGTGKCPRCGGAGKIDIKCAKCRGTGKVLKVEEVKSALAGMAKRLNAVHAGKGE